MLKDYLVVAQEALSAQKEIYQVKQQRLELAQQEYQQLHAVWEHKLGSQVSCEYLPPPAPPGRGGGRAGPRPACASRRFAILSPSSSVPTACADHLFLLLLPCSDPFAICLPSVFSHSFVITSECRPGYVIFRGWGKLRVES